MRRKKRTKTVQGGGTEEATNMTGASARNKRQPETLWSILSGHSTFRARKQSPIGDYDLHCLCLSLCLPSNALLDSYNLLQAGNNIFTKLKCDLIRLSMFNT